MSLVVKVALVPLLVTQALLTRRRMPRLTEPSGPRRGVAGAVGAPRRLRLLVCGDSSAAGVGAGRQRQALAPRLAVAVAAACGVRVSWRLIARSGLTTAETLALLQRELAQGEVVADVAVVVTGVNDVVDQVPSQRAVAAREALANRLRNGHGVHHVVFAPLPPVHVFPALPQPLRWVAGSDARRHNRELVRWARTRGDVSCVDLRVPLHAGSMASDGFHPAEPVYAQCARAIGNHVARRVVPSMALSRG